MKLKSSALTAVVVLLFTVSSLVAQQTATNLIANGGFEQGKDPGGFTTEGVGSKDISDWSITLGSVDYIGTYFQCASGKRCMDLDGTPGPGEIQQSFPTIQGQRYRVTFAMGANRQGPPVVKQVRVSAAGLFKNFVFDGEKNRGWATYRWEFTASSPRTTLAFRSLSKKGNLCGALLDDVSVVRMTAPAAGAAPSSTAATPPPGPPPGFTPCARNAGGSGDTWPCLGPGGTTVYLVLHKPLRNAPVRMFFSRNMAYSTGGSVVTELRGAGVNYQASAPSQLCMGNAPHTYWVGFLDSAGRAYPAQGQYTITGCP